MTDDRREPAATDELDELLPLADGPIRFPEPARGELLDQIIRTTSVPRIEQPIVVPFANGDRETYPPRRRWAFNVAASLVLVIAVALALVVRQNGRLNEPADQEPPAPMTIEETCVVLQSLTAANGLGRDSVQVADVSPEELDEIRRLIVVLSVDERGSVRPELTRDAITRIQLMEISIEASDTSAALNAMTAARASVGAVIDEGC